MGVSIVNIISLNAITTIIVRRISFRLWLILCAAAILVCLPCHMAPAQTATDKIIPVVEEGATSDNVNDQPGSPASGAPYDREKLKQIQNVTMLDIITLAGVWTAIAILIITVQIYLRHERVLLKRGYYFNTD